MAETPVLLTREGPVARLTLNRPQRRNAMNNAMGDALDAALGADPLAAARLELKRRVLGDLPEGPIAAFVAASRRLAAGRVAG